ncbi:S-layer homology domain-containing protein [Pseudobacillus sp. 179-B 2D1 NHS]|uniref:S-layer homology domain-containing protein n=1 Tax=Pseudobacillus sp. 179-B 2D1 NHS TaxID=3374292 RepID=UPI00387938E8
MKKIIKVILPLILLLSFFCSAIQTEASSKFKDIKNHWAEEEIKNLSSKGVISGFKDGTFKPNITVTKAQAAIMIARALNLDLNNRPNPNFADVGTSHTAYKAIAALVDEGYFFKTPKFYPDHAFIRQEMARILVTAYSLKGVGQSHFADVPTWDVKYKDIDALAYNSITQGYPDGTFRPHTSVTRAQFSVFIVKAMQASSDTEKIKEGSIALNKNNVSILEGSEERLIIKRVDYPDKEISADKNQIKWFSENAAVATVDSNGNIRGVSPGTTKIGVIVDGIKIFCTVQVKPIQVSGIDIPSKIIITEGQEQEIIAKVVPEKAHDYKIIWLSSDNNIVSVDANGKIKALKKGTAKIKATISGSNTIYSEAEVTVQEKVLTLEEVTNADQAIYEKYLNQNYNSLPTPMGDWNPTLSVRKADKNVYIEIKWNSLKVSPYDLEYSRPQEEIQKFGKVLSNADRIETKRLLREYMKKIASDTISSYPGYYVSGKFYTSGYRYPYIKEGFWSISFLTWNNFNGNSLTSNLVWDTKHDDYDFLLDQKISKIGYINPLDNKIYYGTSFTDKPIQIKVGETLQLQLAFLPEQDYRNMTYKELGFDISPLLGGQYFDVNSSGLITGKAKGKGSIFIYSSRYNNITPSIKVEVTE